ncbi:unnamed protein product [Malus baccata var. baccata]
MGRYGKITFAKQVYHHSKVRGYFDGFSWKLCIIQRERKCLVVFDDIWSCDAWNSLKFGFPIDAEIKVKYYSPPIAHK